MRRIVNKKRNIIYSTDINGLNEYHKELKKAADNYKMKEEDKYYAPSAEEFHVGFEYESCYEIDGANNTRYYYPDFKPILKDQGYWEYKLFSTTDSVDIMTMGLYNNYENNKQYFRVKYLNAEDIESLGFSEELNCLEQKEVALLFPGSITLSKKIHHVRYYLNSLDPEKPEPRHLRIFIWNEETSVDGKTHDIFNGDIKNKSALKVLLKQLGIE